MNVVLREDVEKLGKRGETVKVADGYGRNYLIPKKLAYPATPGNLKVIEHEKRAKDLRDARILEDHQKVAAVISGLSFTVPKRVGENDVLFGSVTAADIAEALTAKGFEIDRRKLQLAEPLKKLGEVEVPLKLHRDVTTNVKVKVVAEGAAQK